MAWTSPITFVAGSALSAAQMNTYIRDNLNEMAPAKATTAGGYSVSTGTNAIAERFMTFAVVSTSETTTSATYTNLATSGPAVTLTTGTHALVFVAAQMSIASSGVGAWMAFGVTGATTSAAVDNRAAQHVEGPTTTTTERLGMLTHVTLTAGSNTFTSKYRIDGGAVAGTFSNRHIWVMAL